MLLFLSVGTHICEITNAHHEPTCFTVFSFLLQLYTLINMLMKLRHGEELVAFSAVIFQFTTDTLIIRTIVTARLHI